MGLIAERDKFLENYANIRHYSTLRFVMVTAFVALNGGLLNLFFDCEFAEKNAEFVSFFQWSGAILAGIFLIFERALDHNLSEFWNTVECYVGESDALVQHRNLPLRIAVPLATHGFYLVAMGFWWFLSPHYYPCLV